MNLILLFDADFIAENVVRLRDRRYRHLTQILHASPGETFKVGKLNGEVGRGIVRALDTDLRTITLDVHLTDAPPPASDLTFILAMPRPLVLKRVLGHAVTLGVKRILLIGSARVEKSYFHTPLLQPAKLQTILHEALEQAVDTAMPVLTVHRGWRDFIKQEEALLESDTAKWVAHPGVSTPTCDGFDRDAKRILAIGPEGGFIDTEIATLCSAGFQTLSLGPRILRVETAACVAMTKLQLFKKY